jgi:hypothetical protein
MTTRKQKAEELLRRLERGPSIGDPAAEARVRLWIDTWITPIVTVLVPELRPKRTNPHDRYSKIADHVDGYDRDDLGESPDY